MSKTFDVSRICIGVQRKSWFRKHAYIKIALPNELIESIQERANLTAGISNWNMLLSMNKKSYSEMLNKNE